MIRTIRSLMDMGLVACVASLMVACGFGSPASLDSPDDVYRILNTAPYALPFSGERWTVVNDNDPAGLRVDHGWSCVQAERAASEGYLGIRLQDGADLPEGYDATVFLNGWTAHYDETDHHVTGVGSVIFNVRTVDGALIWDAGGLLSDKKGDDAYEWCYAYTLLFWPTFSSDFDMRATHSDPTGQLIFVQDENFETAVHTIPGSFTAPQGQKPPRAALPSGFALGWRRSDHHLAQIGFDLGPQSLAQRTLSWTSATVLKDNASKRDYKAAEAVTILSGRGMRVIQPDEILVLENDMFVPKQNGIQLAPLLKTRCPRVQLGGPRSKIQNYAIDGLTSDYAVPILAGFELAFKCDDQHVKNVGAKIRDFSYDPPSGNSRGTLYVQVETLLTDKDLIPTLNDFVELNVLAIDRL